MSAPDRVTQLGAAQPGTGQPPGRGTSGGALTLLLTSAASFMVTLDALVLSTRCRPFTVTWAEASARCSGRSAPTPSRSARES